jgi:tetratricopeptide (TPR) repeat protein
MMLAGAIAAPTIAAPPTRPPSSLPAPDTAIAAGLNDLHQGLYSRAEEAFRTAGLAAPGDPEPQFFLAYSHYWRILEDPKSFELDDPFWRATEAAVAAGESRLAASPDDPHALVMSGGAHILRSHIEALRHNYLRAAQEARRGKKQLQAALGKDPSLLDPLLMLGAYNYYADRVPALVKGLRAILFLPGGDADLGLAQLRTVAVSKSRLSTDARMVLAVICGARDEGCYKDALEHLDRALRDSPGSPVLLGWIGGIKLRLGFYEEAALFLERAVHAATGQEPDRVRQRRRLRILLAESLVADWRLDEAEAALRAADGEPGPCPESDRKVRARVEAEMRDKRDDGGTAAAERAAREGRTDEALARLKALAAAHPGSALPRFLAGRTLFLAGRFPEAEAEFDAAADLEPEPPPWMEGWIELYLGMAEERAGDPRGARGHYRRASEVRKFRSADRGVLQLRAQEPRDGRCAP